jgi:hypothetical protein
MPGEVNRWISKAKEMLTRVRTSKTLAFWGRRNIEFTASNQVQICFRFLNASIYNIFFKCFWVNLDNYANDCEGWYFIRTSGSTWMVYKTKEIWNEIIEIRLICIWYDGQRTNFVPVLFAWCKEWNKTECESIYFLYFLVVLSIFKGVFVL